jgi:hypothetical protein
VQALGEDSEGAQSPYSFNGMKIKTRGKVFNSMEVHVETKGYKGATMWCGMSLGNILLSLRMKRV